MDMIVWIIVGALAGWIANMIVKTGSSGIVTDIVVGMIGAFVGGWIVALFGYNINGTQLSVPGLLTAILGSVILLAVIKAFRGPRTA